MHMVRIGRHQVEVPSGWEEINTSQLLTLSRYFPFTDTPETRIKMITGLLELFRRPLLGARIYFKVAPWQLTELCLLLDWVFTQPVITSPLIKRFQHGIRVYWGPGTELRDLTVKEFRYAEQAVKSWQKTQSLEALNLFTALLWRERVDGERIGLDLSTVDHRAERLYGCSVRMKKALLIQYMGMRAHVIRAHPVVFGSADFIPDTPPEPTDWGQIVYNMAGSAINMKTVDDMLIWDAFEFLSNSIRSKKETPTKATAHA